jgi:hypothetical protein
MGWTNAPIVVAPVYLPTAHPDVVKCGTSERSNLILKDLHVFNLKRMVYDPGARDLLQFIRSDVSAECMW